MGRPTKISDREKDWYVRRTRCQDRVVNTREVRQRILIVCEGTKTEPNYFRSIERQLPRNMVFVSIQGEGANTLSLVARAREIRDSSAPNAQAFDQVWVVFDRDSFPGAGFDNAIRSAESDDMRGAWSNEAFELWYILHFEYRNTPMSRTEYQGKLDELLAEPYRKNAVDMYEKLERAGDRQQATAWARRLLEDFMARKIPPSGSNPCTTVFQLVEELNRFLPAPS